MAVGRSLLCSGERQGTLGGCGSSSQILPGKTWEGKCEDCRLVVNETHPDLIFLSFEHLLVAEDLKREIGIKNIHELQRLLALAPWRGGRRVVLIDGADALSRDAQTAFLKTLEEPQSTTTFFLITDRPDGLLPTIRSRSVPVGFTPIADEEIARLLADVSPARRRSIVALAAGRPGLAVRLARNTKFFKEFQEALAEYAEVLGADLRDQFAFSERVSPASGRPPRAVGAAAPRSAERAAHGAIGSFFEYLMRRERSELLSSPPTAETAERARFLRSLLEKLSLVEATTVNRRLVADSIFVELAARAGRHSA